MVWAIRLVVLVAFLDLFMQVPIISTYARSLGATAAMGGLIVGIYSASNLFGNVGAGILLDRVNRKWLVVAGLLTTAALLFAYGLVDSPPQLLALRVLHGFAAGTLAPGAFTMLADRTADDQHTRSMGLSGALISGSAVVGPLLSVGIRDAVGGDAGFAAVFTTSGTLMLLSAVAFAVFVPTTESSDVRRTASNDESFSLIRNMGLVRVYLAVLAMTFAIGYLINLLPITLEDVGAAPRMSGMAFATFSLAGMAIMASPLQRAAEDSSRARAIAAGLALLGISNLTLALSGVSLLTVSVFPAMLVFGVGFGLVFPSLSASVAARTAGGRRGTAFGIFYAMYSLGVFLGASISGVIPAFGIGAADRFYAPALLVLVMLLVSVRFRDLRRGNAP